MVGFCGLLQRKKVQRGSIGRRVGIFLECVLGIHWWGG